MGSDRLRGIAAVAMLISGMTHVSQLAVYGATREIYGPAVFGVLYFGIGLLLLGRTRTALWAGATLPAIGGAGGILRFFLVHPNPFSVFHVLIDLVVVPICVVLLRRKKGLPRGCSA